MENKLILDLLRDKSFYKTEEIASIIDVSPSTVRRTLNELQQRGLITRMRGGAKLND